MEDRFEGHKDCMQCKFTLPYRDSGGSVDLTQRVCVEGPPNPVMIPTPKGVQIATMHPVVRGGMFCWRFKSRILVEGDNAG